MQLQLLSSNETKQLGSSCNFYLDYIIITSSNYDTDCLAVQFLLQPKSIKP